MAYALTSMSPAAVAAHRPSFWQRVMRAIESAQLRRAEREIRLYAPYIHETALVNGEFRRTSLSNSDKLPFA